MAKAWVHLNGIASASVKVTIPDGLPDDEAREAALEAAFERGVPGLCHHCAAHMEAPGEWGIEQWVSSGEDSSNIELNVE
jgi:hypothetical protein